MCLDSALCRGCNRQEHNLSSFAKFMMEEIQTNSTTERAVLYGIGLASGLHSSTCFDWKELCRS